MIKKKLVTLFAAILAIAALAATAIPAMAMTPAELEARILKLEQSQQALAQALQAAKADLAKQAAATSKVASTAAAGTTKYPSWVDRITPYGDARFRFERTSFSSMGGSEKFTRNRFRVRLRFGMDAQLHRDVKLGFRIVGGADDDPTSTNTTLEGWFAEHENIGFDRAYVTWTPSFVPDRMLWVAFGKMKNPFVTSKLIWDGDVQPGGGFLKFTLNKKGAFQPFALLGAMFLNEHSGETEDVYAYGGQLGVNGKAGAFKFTLMAGYINWGDTGMVGNVPTNTHGNPEYTIPTPDPDDEEDAFTSKFVVWDILAKVSYKFSAKGKFSVWAHYLNNIDATGPDSDQDTGYAAGVGVAYDKFKVKAWYKYVEANATPGFISDSDSGFVNRKGFVLSVGYKLFKYGTVNLSYYNTEPIEESLDGAYNPSQTIFVDFIFKF